MTIEVTASIVAIIISICAIILNLYTRKKFVRKFENPIQGIEELENGEGALDEDDDTVVMQDQDDKDDDDETTIIGRMLILTNEKTGARLSCRCMGHSTIGRKVSCDISIQEDKAVSGIHCIVSLNSCGNLSIRDNYSANGTFLNGEKITEECVISSGDSLRIGRSLCLVQII